MLWLGGPQSRLEDLPVASAGLLGPPVRCPALHSHRHRAGQSDTATSLCQPTENPEGGALTPEAEQLPEKRHQAWGVPKNVLRHQGTACNAGRLWARNTGPGPWRKVPRPKSMTHSRPALGHPGDQSPRSRVPGLGELCRLCRVAWPPREQPSHRRKPGNSAGPPHGLDPRRASPSASPEGLRPGQSGRPGQQAGGRGPAGLTHHQCEQAPVAGTPGHSAPETSGCRAQARRGRGDPAGGAFIN